MKNIIWFFLLCSIAYSQNWNNIVTTTINEPYLQKMDLLTNKAGNHIIVQNSNSSNSIKYYLLNSSGSVVRSATIETAGNAELPNISGDNEKVYLVYKLGSNLIAKYSTNAGQNWTPIVNKSIGSNACNGVDIVYDYTGLHIVYALENGDIWNPQYETHYYKINSSGSWVDYKNVTDHSSLQYGGFPTVSVSENRAHVSVNTGHSPDPTTNIGDAKTRDKYNTTWQTPQTVSDQGSMVEKIGCSSSKLFNFYYVLVPGGGQYHADLYVKERTLGSTTWSSSTLIKSWAGIEPVVSISNTSDNKSHIVYESPLSSVLYRNYNGSSWCSASTIATDGYFNPVISSVSNDLYVVYKSSSSGYVKYRQFDANPLAPQNVAVTSNRNNNPVISWSANNEPDISSYRVYKKLTTSSGTQITYTTTSSTSYTDTDFIITAPRDATDSVEYWVVAVDNTNHLSPESTHITKSGESIIQWKKAFEDNENQMSSIYQLHQNYPNPFNPSTIISFQLPESGYTILKVYNNLGEEVKELTNEFKGEGHHSITFDASDLSSGIYFYKLQSGIFTQAKKMILLR